MDDATDRANTMCYIARTVETTKRHPANTVVCATVDRPSFAKDNAKEVAKWLRAGLIVERAPVWWCRLFLFTQEPAPAVAPPQAEA